MIDCTGGFQNKGCGGGFMTNCFNYLKTNKIQTESSYPYTGKAGQCKYDASKGVIGVKSYTALPANDPNALL
jgi:cathepsin F